MKVFISWSGARSQATAQAIGPWLRKVIQSIEYWISSDMERGTRWLEEISSSLATHTFGILCVTPENSSSPWLCFEAGALSQHLAESGRVVPYMLEFESEGDLRPPLGQFNACLASFAGTWQLVRTLNMHAEFQQSESDLQETFGLWWPSLEASLEEIARNAKVDESTKRSSDDKVNEILSLVRRMDLDRSPSSHSASVMSISRGIHDAAVSVSRNATPAFMSFLAQRVNARTNQLPPGVTLDQIAVDLILIETAGELLSATNTKIELPESWQDLEERDRAWPFQSET